MGRLPRVLRRMETFQGSFCDCCFLVSLVCTEPILKTARPLTDIFSDIAYYGINLNQSIILARINYAEGATPWDTLYKTAVGNIIVQAAVGKHLALLPFSPNYKYRDSCLGFMSESFSRIALGAHASSCIVASQSVFCTLFGPGLVLPVHTLLPQA